MRAFFKIANNTLYYGFVILVLVVTAALFVMRSDALGGVELKIVRSGSMEPAIPTGALIVVREAPSYGVGDVITFGADTATQIPTTHRIMEVEKNAGATTFVTQGDANENIDPTPVAASSVIGKVVYSAPKVGYIFDFARQPLGFLLLIGIPAGLIILDELMVMFGEAKRIMGRRKEDEEVSEDQKDNAKATRPRGARVPVLNSVDPVLVAPRRASPARSGEPSVVARPQVTTQPGGVVLIHARQSRMA